MQWILERYYGNKLKRYGSHWNNIFNKGCPFVLRVAYDSVIGDYFGFERLCHNWAIFIEDAIHGMLKSI